MVEQMSSWGGGIIAVLSGFVALLSFFLCHYFSRKDFLPDMVTSRSNHTVSTSRAGGIALFVAYLVGIVILISVDINIIEGPLLHLTVFSLAMVGVGLIDDIIGLRPAYKFLGQFVIAIGFVASCGGIAVAPFPLVGLVNLGWLGYGIGIFWIVSFVNVFNFMDGLDGMAAGTGIVAGIAIALAAIWNEAMGLFAVSFLLIGALMGFMVINFRNGAIFLGDGGSLGLGFFFAGLAILTSQDGPMPQISSIGFLFMPMIFLPFILDVTKTLWMRARAGEKLYEAHKQHIYQKIAAAGASHQQVAFLYMALALLCALAAFANMQLALPNQWIGPVVMITVLVVAWRFSPFGIHAKSH